MIDPLRAGTDGFIHSSPLAIASRGLLGGEAIAAGVGLPSRFMDQIYREDEEMMAIIMAALQSGILK